MGTTEEQNERLRIKDWAEDDKPRERLLKLGAKALSDAELIAILLRTGTTEHTAVDLSKLILSRNGNDLDRVGRSTVADLRKVKGVGKVKALTIAAALELGMRRREAGSTERPRIATSADAYEVLRGRVADLPVEEFWLMLLDRGLRVTELCRISTGGMHGTVADPKVIFKEALDRRASAIILCHNHPSGQLRPSEEDLRLTRKLVEGGRLIDIIVQDQLIVTSGGYYSFADNGLM
ncbi:MAG: DNA repair protein RadC [Flavobacteriales bacterium]|nr:DNA repair protein RadC [Flavobacteriales bacterium]